MVNKGALKMGLVVGGALLGVLVLGQVVAYIARILARVIAITGAVLIAAAVGVADAAYQVYSGWQRAESGAETSTDQQTAIDVEDPSTEIFAD